MLEDAAAEPRKTMERKQEVGDDCDPIYRGQLASMNCKGGSSFQPSVLKWRVLHLI